MPYLKKLKKIFFLILFVFLLIPFTEIKAEVPTVTTYSPASGATDIAIDADLVLTFSVEVSGVSGKNIEIHKYTDESIVESIDAGSDAQVIISDGGTTVTINPSANFTNLTKYYVLIDGGAFKNGGDDYAGITDKDTWNFTTIAAGAGTKRAGDTCNPDAAPSECFKDLTCDSGIKKCVPVPGQRRIGTWCQAVQQCEHAPTDLTCDKSEYYCVGSLSGTPCLDSDVNNLEYDPTLKFGIDATTLDSTERCDTGLVCDPDEGKCVNDWGQTKIPAGKLGETATDIRDQIRNLINIALGFLGVAGVIVTIYGGALWMSAAGDDEKVGKAKKTIIAGVIGLVIIGIAWTIVSYVLNVTQSIA